MGNLWRGGRSIASHFVTPLSYGDFLGSQAMIEVSEMNLAEVLLIHQTQHFDERGFFSEVFNQRDMQSEGITGTFVQDNHSLSKERGTVRGLHFQIDPAPTGKLVRVTRGAIWDVAVDIRKGSPTFGQHVGVELSAENWLQIYVPVGFAHGFCTLQSNTEVLYKVTDYWSPAVDRGLAWDDPDLRIEWPVSATEAILSDKDRSQPKLADLPSYFTWRDS